MTTRRLALSHLTFVGTAVEPARVEFGPRTTVIRGPSDTGKSFIVSAIDFMLGGQELKDIPERAGYATVLLGLMLPSGAEITLSRPVTGGNFGLHDGHLATAPDAPADRTLQAKHGDSLDTLSGFLLAAVGLGGKRVRKNVSNQTLSLSFRNLAQLCVVDETRMQAETPPALTGMPTNKTAEISTLKLLLENEDDSGLVAVPTRKELKQTAAVRGGVIDRMIADLEQSLHETAADLELRGQLARLSTSIEKSTTSIGNVTSQRSVLSGQIVATERLAAEERSRLDDVVALQARFGLLLSQYESDLSRLEMISEAGNLLGYFNPGQCVFCGADAEHQHYNDDCAEDSTAFRDSVVAEREKTTNLRADLSATLGDLHDEGQTLARRLGAMRDAIGGANLRLAALDEALRPDQGTLKELLEKRSDVEKSLGLYDQIDRLRDLRQQLDRENASETATAVVGIQIATLTAFSADIGARLTAWGVPDADDTRYDRNEQDIVAGNQLRSAHGKGVRAVLHSAFTLGLLEFCADRDLPHPGFVVLDSPLVTYRAPEEHDAADNALPGDFAARFYADVQDGIAGQVVVLENIDPPEGLAADTVDIVFTKSEQSGRYGFFPIPGR